MFPHHYQAQVHPPLQAYDVLSKSRVDIETSKPMIGHTTERPRNVQAFLDSSDVTTNQKSKADLFHSRRQFRDDFAHDLAESDVDIFVTDLPCAVGVRVRDGNRSSMLREEMCQETMMQKTRDVTQRTDSRNINKEAGRGKE